MTCGNQLQFVVGRCQVQILFDGNFFTNVEIVLEESIQDAMACFDDFEYHSC